jgi:putative salt-induced outer membrane protein YdiY
MKMTQMQTAVATVVALAMAGAARADQVALNNGDRLTGAVIALSRTAVTVDTEFAGRVAIKWSAVSGVTATVPVRATLAGGEVVEGALAVADGHVSVQRAGDRAIAIDVPTLRTLEMATTPASAAAWHGTLNAGVDISRGNSETSTITTSGTATRLGRRDRLGLFGTYLFSEIGTGTAATTTARTSRGGMRYDHDVLGRLFGFGFGDVENDPLQLLDLRIVGGGGAGAHLVKTDSTQFNLFSGVSYASDSYSATSTTTTTPTTTPTTPVTNPAGKVVPGLSRGGTPPAVVRTSLSRQVGEWLVGQDVTHQLSDNVNLTEGLSMYSAIGDSQDYRVSFDLSLSAQINSWLQWNVTVADRYLHIPPAGGAVQNDKFITTGLGVTFGHGGGGTYTGADAPPAAAPRKP